MTDESSVFKTAGAWLRQLVDKHQPHNVLVGSNAGYNCEVGDSVMIGDSVAYWQNVKMKNDLLISRLKDKIVELEQQKFIGDRGKPICEFHPATLYWAGPVVPRATIDELSAD
jgi:hypothetical protein